MYNETEVVRLISEGDEIAFSELFHHYTSRLSIHINAIIKKPDSVEDIVQETFVRVWLNRDKLPEVANIRAWIFTIASNACYNHLRSLFREEQRIQKISAPDIDPELIHKQIDLKEMQNVVNEAIHLLSPQRKKVWQLQREEGLKQAEIADRLNVSLSTVKNTIAQSLEFIRAHLKKKGYTMTIVMLATFLKYFLEAR